MARRNFGTPIDEDLQLDFKRACKERGFKQNEVVEALMQGFVDGKIKIVKKVMYDVQQEN